MTRRHLVDQYAPNLSARLGALSLEQRRRVLAESCAAMSERVPGLDPALRLLVDAAVQYNALSPEELANGRAYADMADVRYFDLQEDPATAAESHRWFVQARLATALANAFGESDAEAAADAAYELCIIDDDAGVAIPLIEAAIVRQKAS